MPIAGNYVLAVSMDIDPDHADLVNEVYDTEHIPYLLEVPGVIAATRGKGEAFRFFVGGAEKDVPAPAPAYTALYEIESPEVLTSPEWQSAVERGRWPGVRQYTSNRVTALYKVR